ncbi:MAG: hypothetical protein PHC30_05560, partial [Lentisphaeria bacterium]|nr:hypothetical protein [Lentisphaeria bacterium]
GLVINREFFPAVMERLRRRRPPAVSLVACALWPRAGVEGSRPDLALPKACHGSRLSDAMFVEVMEVLVNVLTVVMGEGA